MLVFGNEREIQQGEDWNLDILISQSGIEYIPFIISSERHNPMFALTVASTKYEKNARYVMTWWDNLNASSLPRFYQTTPFRLSKEYAPGETIIRPDGHAPMEALYQYTLTSEKVDPVLGHKPYHYVYFTEDAPNDPKDGYECRLIKQIRSEVTSQWGSQNYMYQITLVDTISMADYINQAYESYPNLAWPKWVTRDDPAWDGNEATWVDFRNNWIMSNVKELFNFIKNRIPAWFQSDIDWDSPAGYISTPQVILPPTKLQVNNNLRQII